MYTEAIICALRYNYSKKYHPDHHLECSHERGGQAMPHLAILRPLALHGALGFWDEAISLFPLISGGALLIYFYVIGLTRRRRKDRQEPEDKG